MDRSLSNLTAPRVRNLKSLQPSVQIKGAEMNTTPNNPPDGFTELFLRHQADLKAFIVAVVRDWGRSEDILQEVSIVLWKKFHQYDRTRPFGAWARGVAYREVLKDRRRDARGLPTLSPEAMLALDQAFAQTEEPVGPRRLALEECMSALEEQPRKILSLRYKQDFSIEEIASNLNRPVTAITKSLSRLRTQLQQCVERRLSHSSGGLL